MSDPARAPSFLAKIDGAARDYANGNLAGAVGKLNSLTAQIDAQDGKKLSSAQATLLRTAAQTSLDDITAA